MTTAYHEISSQLVNAVNDYGSKKSQSYMEGVGRSEWQQWVSKADEIGIEEAVKALDAFCADD